VIPDRIPYISNGQPSNENQTCVSLPSNRQASHQIFLLDHPTASTMDSDRYTLAPRSVHTWGKIKIHREPGNRFPGEWRGMRNTEDQNELQQATLRDIISRYIALVEEERQLTTERQRRVHRNIRQLNSRLSSDDRIRLALAIAESSRELDISMYSILFEIASGL
jgi:hypothetical protein